MNSFQKRAERATRILSCYSNIGDCIPQPLKKAEDITLLKKAEGNKPLGQSPIGKEELTKAHKDLDEALQLVKGGNGAKADNKALVKTIICNAVDSGLIDDERFLKELAKLDNQ